jgi:hypothetical protein
MNRDRVGEWNRKGGDRLNEPLKRSGLNPYGVLFYVPLSKQLAVN